ncbi:MAG: preprotein translocase subunit SecA [Chloroflexaceae bacterium]|nr:preprotein translocase subunit SecA [Chloroflexaceae bacterium]
MVSGLRKLTGDTNEKAVKQVQPYVKAINELDDEFKQMHEDELRGITAEFRERIAAGETLDDLLPEAFAAVREASRRTIGLRHYDVQLIGGIVLHQGKIAEMRTGEGKTLVATLPLYLNALAGKGCHLITVNDYLAKVGAGWMGPIYHYLGLSVGFIAHEYSARYDPDYVDPDANQEDSRLVHWRACTRQEAYAADITYGTNNEFGFDYLRDNMAIELERVVQRELFFAIVDEVDNILIDEARTPLIISGPAQKSSDEYKRMASLIRRLRLKRSTVSEKDHKQGIPHDGDYLIDERARAISLTEAGIEKIEQAIGIPADESLYDPKYYELTPFVENALRAEFIFHRDKDYMVTREGDVLIVDEFTGRPMPGRRWSDGLHQAVEAKEGVEIRNENVTMATITFQNYFRMYQKLAGMTGTAYTEREEFGKIYDLDVVVIPTHRTMVREDFPDQVYRTETAKFNAIARDVKELQELGRPVLIGTTSVETSERLSQIFNKEGISHAVLNAKQHEREAFVVAQAGRKSKVTIATNMAGRGTDILLGGNPDGLVEALLAAESLSFEDATPEQHAAALQQARAITEAERQAVITLGGMHVIGTERHESRRIDNQLRGRAGRQGDPGSSRFYISLEDELMRRFGRMEMINNIMKNISADDDLPVESRMLDKVIEGAQTRVEGYNFDIRKHTVEFDDVMNTQRQVIYADRRAILSGADMHERVLEMVGEEVAALMDDYLPDDDHERELWDYEALLRAVQSVVVALPEDFTVATIQKLSRAEIEDALLTIIEEEYQQRETAITAENMRFIERRLMLAAIDRQWIDYLTAMDELRQTINLQAYAQRNPLVEFKKSSFEMFAELKDHITHDIVYQMIPTSYRYEEQLRAIEEEQQRRLAAAQASGGSSEIQNTVAKRKAPRTVQKEFREPGRNDLCPCGSGKKYKYCHLGRLDEIKHLLQPAGPSGAALVAGDAPEGVTAAAPATVARGRQAPANSNATPQQGRRKGKGSTPASKA